MQVVRTIGGPDKIVRRRRCCECHETFTSAEKFVGATPEDRKLHLAQATVTSIIQLIENSGFKFHSSYRRGDVGDNRSCEH